MPNAFFLSSAREVNKVGCTCRIQAKMKSRGIRSALGRATMPSHGERVLMIVLLGLQAEHVKECHYILRECGLQDSLQAIEAATGIVSVLPF